MSSDLGAAWRNNTPASQTKKNLTSVISGEGSYIESLDKTQHKLLVANTDGSSVKADHVYLTPADGESALIDLASIIFSTAGTAILHELNLTYLPFTQKATWNQITSGTGAITDDTTANEYSVKLDSGGTSGGAATIGFSSLKLDFSQNSVFRTKLKLSSTAAIAMKAGVNCETISAADDNTEKYEAQVCTVTNANWNLRTADGSNKSESDTGTAFSTSKVAIKLEHYPTASTPKVDMYIDSGSVFTKTTNIPISGTSALDAVVKFSLKNSAAASKTCNMYGCKLNYSVSDTWN